MVQDITWNTDPEGDEPAVTVTLSDTDFDVIGDDEALEAFLTGWTAER